MFKLTKFEIGVINSSEQPYLTEFMQTEKTQSVTIVRVISRTLLSFLRSNRYEIFRLFD